MHHYTEVPGFDEQCFESCKNSLDGNIESYKSLEHSNEPDSWYKNNLKEYINLFSKLFK